MSIWDKFPDYDESELELLVRSAAETLADAGQGRNLPPDALELSDKAAADEIRADIVERAPEVSREQIRALLRNSDASRRLCLAALDVIRGKPELAAAVDAAYQRQMRKLGSPELLLAVAPLILLVLRVESVDLKTGHITFGNSAEAVKAFVAGLVSGFTGQASGAN